MIRLPARARRLRRFSALLVSLLLSTSALALADDGDVLVQAGHEGRPASCALVPGRACNLGAAAAGEREIAWTTIVADEAVRVLRAHDYRVLRRPADYLGRDSAKAAVFVHFDGVVGENFTENEHKYYGFRLVDAPEKMLVELGELTCPAQREWMKPRLRAMGDQLAEFLMERVTK